MAKKIESRNDLFRGELIDKPPVGLCVSKPFADDPQYGCPHCNAVVDLNDCDVLGAEPGCVFCPKCSGEFEI